LSYYKEINVSSVVITENTEIINNKTNVNKELWLCIAATDTVTINHTHRNSDPLNDQFVTWCILINSWKQNFHLNNKDE